MTKLSVSNWTRFNSNTVHLGLRSPHMVADLMEEGRRWDALLLACLPAFV
jgi:hypothetical protein